MPAYSADLMWRAPGELDLALLRIANEPRPKPTLDPVFASYNLVKPIAEVDAAGFPEAWRNTQGVRDYRVRGVLRIVSQFGTYAWSIPPTDKPDDPIKWKGMSGAVACLVGSDDNLYLFGVVQEVPANFSGGQLQVASLSEAFNDLSFRQHLQTVLGGASHIVPYSIEPKRSNPIDMVYSQPPPSTGSAQPIPRLPVNFVHRTAVEARSKLEIFRTCVLLGPNGMGKSVIGLVAVSNG